MDLKPRLLLLFYLFIIVSILTHEIIAERPSSKYSSFECNIFYYIDYYNILIVTRILLKCIFRVDLS